MSGSNEVGNDPVEILRVACDRERRALRDAVQSGGDVEVAARSFASAFNDYQDARAQIVGLKPKRVSAFHVMKNLGQILGGIRD